MTLGLFLLTSAQEHKMTTPEALLIGAMCIAICWISARLILDNDEL
jgi:hypothetical protein